MHYPVRYRKGAGEETFDSFCGNISQGGLMFKSAVPFSAGDTAWIEIDVQQLDFSKKLTILSRVIWTDDRIISDDGRMEYLVGVQFKDLANEAREVLIKLARTYCK